MQIDLGPYRSADVQPDPPPRYREPECMSVKAVAAGCLLAGIVSALLSQDRDVQPEVDAAYEEPLHEMCLLPAYDFVLLPSYGSPSVMLMRSLGQPWDQYALVFQAREALLNELTLANGVFLAYW